MNENTPDLPPLPPPAQQPQPLSLPQPQPQPLTQPPKPPSPASTGKSESGGFFSFGLFGKCAAIAVLVLLLQIPLMMINSLSNEREGRRNEAVQEISSRWGGEQTLVGPILMIPYEYVLVTTQDGSQGPRQVRQRYRAQAYFLPEELKIEGSMETETRKRGIYSAVVYNSGVTMKGRFAAPNFKQAGAQEGTILWNEARIMLCVSDIQGLRTAPGLKWGEQVLPWQPGTRWSELKQGLHAAVPNLSEKSEYTEFSIAFELNGSGVLSFAPLGKHSSVALHSSWPDPSFTGAYLPERRSVGDKGFEANWNLSHLARSLPQQWCDSDNEADPAWNDFKNCTVGVSLAHAVDSYRTMDRALKHGILFLALVFTAFFLFEMTSVGSLSTLHYALVGGALCLFYLALLALSEFTSFSTAYLVASGASALLITLYSSAVLRSGIRALLILGGLLFVYAYLYFVLQMQDYALLAGTFALFTALAGIMWVTRKAGRTQPSATKQATA